MAALVILAGLGAVGCHVKQELNPSGPGSETSQVIKFENLYSEVLIRIPDAHQEFFLKAQQSRTVEVHSDDEITTFYVEIIRVSSSYTGDLALVAYRWSGFVNVGQRVTIQHISRISVND
jgi:hypothetical protein